MKVINRRFSPFVTMILFFVGFTNYLTAQNIQAAPYDLRNCIYLAVQNSYQLQSDSLLSRLLEMQVKQEQVGSYPQISGALGFSGLFLSPYTFGQHYLQAIADWDLGKFWYKTKDIQQKQVEYQQALKQQHIQEISGVISGLYLDVQKSELELQILQSRLAYLNQHLDILTLQWKAGTNNRLDILQTKSTIDQVIESAMQKELELSQTKYIMARLIGLDSDSGFSLSPIVGPPVLFEIDNEVENNFLQTNPSVIAVQKEYEAELLKEREVRASFLPHIQAFSGYTFDGDPTGDGNFIILGLGASIPVYQWGKKDYQLNEIAFSSRAIQSEKQNVERELSIRYGQIVKQIRQYRKIIDFQKEKIANDEEAANIAEMNYKSGLSTNLDFLIAQQTLTETRLNLNAARNRYLKSLVAYYLLTGQTENIKNIR